MPPPHKQQMTGRQVDGCPSTRKCIWLCYDLELWLQALKTSSMPTHMVNICAKFNWNISTKYGDIASHKIGVNGWMIFNSRTDDLKTRCPLPTTVGRDIKTKCTTDPKLCEVTAEPDPECKCQWACCTFQNECSQQQSESRRRILPQAAEPHSWNDSPLQTTHIFGQSRLYTSTPWLHGLKSKFTILIFCDYSVKCSPILIILGSIIPE